MRTGAIVVIAIAMLNATTGLCLCRAKELNPAVQTGSHACCQRSAPAFSAHGTACCHMENVPHAATSPDVVAATQPSVASSPVLVHAVRLQAPLVGAQAFTPSPPGRILRI